MNNVVTTSTSFMIFLTKANQRHMLLRLGHYFLPLAQHLAN